MGFKRIFASSSGKFPKNPCTFWAFYSLFFGEKNRSSKISNGYNSGFPQIPIGICEQTIRIFKKNPSFEILPRTKEKILKIPLKSAKFGQKTTTKIQDIDAFSQLIFLQLARYRCRFTVKPYF